jgi:hypothetical protein
VPFVINFRGTPPIGSEAIRANIAHARSLGLPYFNQAKGRVEHLAVVGGGPSINANVASIALFPDVWAVNGAWEWCYRRGIEAVFVAVDPCKVAAEWAKPVAAANGMAIVATQCDPEVFEVLKDCRILVYDTGGENGCVRGTCAVTVPPTLAPFMGYRAITLFGCEGSYVEQSHAYQHEEIAEWMIVECGREEYRTRPDFYTASKELSAMIREFPFFLREKSGGLLRAMIENDGKHDVVRVSNELAEQLKPAIAEQSKPATTA